MDERDDMLDDELDEQLEQMILDNGILLHALINVLQKKGVFLKNELEEEVERLYAEMERMEESDENERE